MGKKRKIPEGMGMVAVAMDDEAAAVIDVHDDKFVWFFITDPNSPKMTPQVTAFRRGSQILASVGAVNGLTKMELIPTKNASNTWMLMANGKPAGVLVRREILDPEGVTEHGTSSSRQ